MNVQHETLSKLFVGLVATIAGGLVGWSASALTLAGRVSAIESALARIEARMDRRESPNDPPAVPRRREGGAP